ncbi:MAG: glycine cleavage system aminomethyltransferase GcvT, partial [Acidobacteriota bacterium]|nr:glycine cleavage system aminomethyltransferase GcvT [Acidobacteriota bacterium]
RLLMVVNAANTHKDLEWIRRHTEGRRDVTVRDETAETARLALQGPHSRDLLAPLSGGFDAQTMKFYRVASGEVAGRPAVVSRTGYTGEIGFEIFVSRDDALPVWNALIAEGEHGSAAPIGLGARDTLRLEAGLPLYGNDIDEGTDVLAAGLDFIVDWEKGDFVGRDALSEVRRAGPQRRRAGFVVTDRGIARQGAEILGDEGAVGTVTSGSWSPTLEKAIGMAYLPPALAIPDTRVTIDVRGRRLAAEVVALPFYRRQKARARS